MVSVPQENDTSLLPKRLNATSCRLVACSTQTKKATEPPGIKLVEDMNRLMLTNARQNVMALKQTRPLSFGLLLRIFSSFSFSQRLIQQPQVIVCFQGLGLCKLCAVMVLQIHQYWRVTTSKFYPRGRCKRTNVTLCTVGCSFWCFVATWSDLPFQLTRHLPLFPQIFSVSS